MFHWDNNNHGLANHCQVITDTVPCILSIFLYDDLCIESRPPVALDAAGCYWTHCRATPWATVPVAASGGLVLCHAPDTGTLSVAFLLTSAFRASTLPLPSPLLGAQPLQVVALNGAPYLEALLASVLPDLSMAAFASTIFSDLGLTKLGPVGDRSLTVKTDTHSFGVLLLELVTWRHFIDSTRPAMDLPLAAWAMLMLRDRTGYRKLGDPTVPDAAAGAGSERRS